MGVYLNILVMTLPSQQILDCISLCMILKDKNLNLQQSFYVLILKNALLNHVLIPLEEALFLF